MFHFIKVFDLLLTDIYLPAKTTVKLTPDAFLEPSLYTEVSETEVRVKQLKDYISGDININPGLKVSKWWEYIKKVGSTNDKQLLTVNEKVLSKISSCLETMHCFDITHRKWMFEKSHMLLYYAFAIRFFFSVRHLQ